MHALGQQPISLGERADHQFGCAGFPRRQRDQTCLTNAWAAIPSLNPNQPAGVSSGAQKPTRRFSEGRISSVELSSTASSRRDAMSNEAATATHCMPSRVFATARGPPIATSSPHQPAPGSTHSNVNRPLTHRAHSQKKHHEDNPKLRRKLMNSTWIRRASTVATLGMVAATSIRSTPRLGRPNVRIPGSRRPNLLRGCSVHLPVRARGRRSLGAGSTAEMSRHRSASMWARRRYVMSSRGPPNRDLSPQIGASPEFTAMKDRRQNEANHPSRARAAHVLRQPDHERESRDNHER